MNLIRILEYYTFSISDWDIYDVRVAIPSLSYGSDAINPHTQYSNPLLFLNSGGFRGVGISFTLGDGNDILCCCIKKILANLQGISMKSLLATDGQIYEKLANPEQLRWLSPNSGVVYMAAAAILNTLLDWASKRLNMPLWKALSLEPSDNLLKFCSLRQYSPFLNASELFAKLEAGLSNVQERISLVESTGLPVYFTTWIGDSAADLSKEISEVYAETGIDGFKIKVNSELDLMKDKIDSILSNTSDKLTFYADANQTLDYDTAVRLSKMLAGYGLVWLEEPFAPDNVRLHSRLRNELRSEAIRLEIVSGENCPNAHTALAFIQSAACDRFQIDACRMLSLCDIIPTLVAASLANVDIVPHAGGSGLDELVLHLKAFELTRVCPNNSIHDSLTEHVGFCSRFFSPASAVADGKAQTPKHPGYLGDVSDIVYSSLRRDGETKWLTL